MRQILRPEDSAARDAPDAAETYKSRRCKRPLPLATDVVGLVGEDGWDSAVGRRTDEEAAEVLGTHVVDPSLRREKCSCQW